MSHARRIQKQLLGGPNLEVAKFGMYIMFPIGFMYYFGINLDSRFAVPDFWPKKEQTHTIPFEREEIREELERLKAIRLARRARRLAAEGEAAAVGRDGDEGEGKVGDGEGSVKGRGWLWWR